MRYIFYYNLLQKTWTVYRCFILYHPATKHVAASTFEVYIFLHLLKYVRGLF